VDPTLGYLYQVRSALLWSLQRLKAEPPFLVSIETLDDVAFETTTGDPIALLQTKHHQQALGSLTDASADLWKTLRVWCEAFNSGSLLPHTTLCLVTTGTAPQGSAASLLRAASRDVVQAQQLLNGTAVTSTSQSNMAAYQAYLSMQDDQRTSILDRITILDASPTAIDLDAKLRAEVYWATEHRFLVPFLERLEGWWLRRVLRQLTDSPDHQIGSVEIDAMMSDLREQFKHDSLPIDLDLIEFTLDDATGAAHADAVFVKQLELIDVNRRRIGIAIRDYYRAFEQRSRWLRDDLVVDMDLGRYEKRLCEEWESVFEAMRDALGDLATDEAKRKAAQQILHWAEGSTISIRPGVTEPFVSRGSLHMLSDDKRIGWHPNFKELLAIALSTASHD